MNTRTLLVRMSIAALLAWGGLLLFTRYIPPQGVPVFILFFTLLVSALLCTIAPLIYCAQRAILHTRPTWKRIIRQSALLSLWIMFNLVLRILHSWNFFTAVVSLGIVVVIEILLAGQK